VQLGMYVWNMSSEGATDALGVALEVSQGLYDEIVYCTRVGQIVGKLCLELLDLILMLQAPFDSGKSGLMLLVR